jgi:hypothetical protein
MVVVGLMNNLPELIALLCAFGVGLWSGRVVERRWPKARTARA